EEKFAALSTCCATTIRLPAEDTPASPALTNPREANSEIAPGCGCCVAPPGPSGSKEIVRMPLPLALSGGRKLRKPESTSAPELVDARTRSTSSASEEIESREPRPASMLPDCE